MVLFVCSFPFGEHELTSHKYNSLHNTGPVLSWLQDWITWGWAESIASWSFCPNLSYFLIEFRTRYDGPAKMGQKKKRSDWTRNPQDSLLAQDLCLEGTEKWTSSLATVNWSLVTGVSWKLTSGTFFTEPWVMPQGLTAEALVLFSF